MTDEHGVSRKFVYQQKHKACAALDDWKGSPRVEFNGKAINIVVDGKPRQSHGKGVRAILYAAIAIGLLRYCANNNRPHPGVVVIDSPLDGHPHFSF